jgi:hypothetical protein
MFTRSKPASDHRRLPLGAEAALWSIVEVIPDPRNHLALTRDPTAEVRLSAAQIEAVAAAPVPAATASSAPEPAAAAPSPTIEAELPPPPDPPPPPPPVPATSALTLPSSVMARLRHAALDWAADSPEAASAGSPPVAEQLSPEELASLERALDGAVRIDLDGPIQIAVEPDTHPSVTIPVSGWHAEPDPPDDPDQVVDEGIRELFATDA